MNTLSRLQPISSPEHGERGNRWNAVRVIVEDAGADLPQVTLSPGDRLLVENRTGSRLQVTPLDFFGCAFARFTLAPGQTTSPMVVSGLWFQVELHVNGRRFFPLDIYLAPNRAE